MLRPYGVHLRFEFVLSLLKHLEFQLIPVELDAGMVDLFSYIGDLRLRFSDLLFQLPLVSVEFRLVSPLKSKIPRSRTPGIFKCVCQFRSRRLQEMQRRSGIIQEQSRSVRNANRQVIIQLRPCRQRVRPGNAGMRENDIALSQLQAATLNRVGSVHWLACRESFAHW